MAGLPRPDIATGQPNRQRIRAAFGWSALAELAIRVIGPAIYLLLARILTPDDFGVFATAVIVVSLSQIFSDAGLAKALIQRDSQIDDASNAVFWMNTIFGVLLMSLIILLGPKAGAMSGDGQLGAVLQLMSLQVLFLSLTSVHAALLQRSFRYRALFWCRCIGAILPGLIAVPLASVGYGVWALAVAAVVSQAVQSGLLWWTSNWNPKLTLNLSVALQLLSFGFWASCSALLGWYFMWIDILFIAYYFDINQLGIYRTGNMLVALVMGLVAAPVLPVAYNVLARYQANLPELRRQIGQIETILIYFAVPLGALLFLFQDAIAELLFDRRWEGIGLVIGLVGVAQAIAYTVSVRQEAYRAIGRPDLEAKTMLVSVVMRTSFYLAFVGFGIRALLLARIASTCLGVVIHAFVARRFLGLPMVGFLRTLRAPVIATILMLMISTSMGPYLSDSRDSHLGDLVLLSVCITVYAGTIHLLDRSFFKNGFTTLLRFKRG